MGGDVLKRLMVIVVPVLVVASVAVLGTGSAPIASASGAPCGTMTLSSTHYQHVIWVWMENNSAPSVIGAGDGDPYINSLADSCGLATNYHNISHPSLPNYIAATSGLGLSSLSIFTGDCTPSRRCSTTAASIFGQGESWRSYEESMPFACDRSDDVAAHYAVRHNPPPYYRKLEIL